MDLLPQKQCSNNISYKCLISCCLQVKAIDQSSENAEVSETDDDKHSTSDAGN